MEPELKVDVAELRAQMGRANVNQTRLAALSGVHRNTITNILQTASADLESIAAITRALNEVLRADGHREISPFDLMKPTGFPSPQIPASVAVKQPAY